MTRVQKAVSRSKLKSRNHAKMRQRDSKGEEKVAAKWVRVS